MKLFRRSVLVMAVVVGGCSGRTEAPTSRVSPPPPATGGSGGAPSSVPVTADAAAVQPGAPPGEGGAEPAATPDAAPLPPPPNQSFTCNLVLGTNQTAEWFNAGFETIVDGSKWELMHAHSAFIELWADPGSKVWSEPIASRCTQNAAAPDRVILLALAGGPNGGLSNYPLEKWLPPLTAAVKNIQTHYPSVKRIELMSYVRGPMNGTCPGAPEYRTMVYPSQDQAMAMVAAANPGLVVVAPKWEARSCGDFAGNPPHSNHQGAMAWAKMIGQYYSTAH
jgi:hypothetical protein